MTLRTSFYQSVVFPFTDLIFHRDTFRAYRELKDLESLSMSRLREYQMEKLRELLEESVRCVPYYREWFSEGGFDLRRIRTLKDFSTLPVLTKSDIREHRERLVSERYAGSWKEFPTSGSTGTPLVVLEDQPTNAWRRAVKWRYLSWWGVEIGDRGAVIWLQPISGFKGRFMKRIGFALNNCNTFLDVADLRESRMMRFWRQLVRRRVSYLYGYTSAVATFARFVIQNRLNESNALNLKVVIPTTETLFQSQREEMEKAFSCKVANEYGCAELGDIAFECPLGNLHIAAHTYLVEVVPPYLPQETGVAGSIVVTHLRKKTMPLIRYALGDVVHLVDRDCPCGRTLPLIQSVEGRVSDIITTPSGKVLHSEVFDYIMREFSRIDHPAVVAFRAVQNTPAQFDIIVVPGPAYSEATREGIARQFEKAFGREAAVAVREVDRIPPDPSGKMRFFLSKVSR